MTPEQKKLITREQARAEIRRQGITVREWSEQRGVDPKIVFEVLGGRKKGHWGAAHRAAVLLGLKDGVLE